jgi:hypothetical protein
MFMAMRVLQRPFVAVWLLLVSVTAVACQARNEPAPDTGNESGAGARPVAVQLQVGDPAPQFSLPGSDGMTYSLASYRGRQAVVLAWFVKAFSAP